MLSSKSKNGRKIADRGNAVLSHEAVKLLKTQDSGYLRTMLQQTRRAIEKLEQEFVLGEKEGADILLGDQSLQTRRHAVFVDTTKQQKQYWGMQHGASTSGKEPSHEQAQPNTETSQIATSRDSDSLSTSNRESKREVQHKEQVFRDEQSLRKKHRKERDARKSKLSALKSREKDLIDAEDELELQRAKTSNSIGGVTKAGKTWRIRERKK